MNSAEPAQPKRSHHKKKLSVAPPPPVMKPKLPNLDPHDPAVWQETARHALEGNTKLARAIDTLREGLQTLVYAEVDHSTKPPTPVTSLMLRQMAAETLDHYSAITGQNWRNPKHQVVRSRAGDKNQATLEQEGYSDAN